MEWRHFEKLFHPSWHTYMKKWVESENSNKVYSFLKSRKGKEIVPKANLTFRPFETPLNKVKVVIFIEEPYVDKNRDGINYADGIALSCDYANDLHPMLQEFYFALEREFYGLNLNIIMNNDLNYYIHQGVLFLNSSLTSEIGNRYAHKMLWSEFNGNLIKNVFCKKNIPLIFCGKNVYEEYTTYLSPKSVTFTIDESIIKKGFGNTWDTQNVFTNLNEHLLATNKSDILWLQMDVPF